MLPTLINVTKRKQIDLGDRPRILITRLSAIGDCILTMPLVTELKKTWPNSEITWIVDCAASSLLHHHPHVDHVIRLKKGFLLRAKELWQLRNDLKQTKFDLAIDPQGLFKSGLLTWLSGAPRRFGFNKCQSREGAANFYTDRRHPLTEHIVERHLELLEMCNIEMPTANCTGDLLVDFGWNDALIDAAEVTAELRRMKLTEKKYVAINPGAGWESKCWPVDRYAVLADQLFARTGLRSLVLWGNPRELDLAKTIVALAPESTVLAPETDLIVLSQLLHRAAIFIGSDTGPMHLAAAVGTSCIAMFGTSLAHRSGPYGRQHCSIQKRYDSGSSRYRRSTTNAAMRAIQVAEVLQACLTKLCERGIWSQPETYSIRRVA